MTREANRSSAIYLASSVATMVVQYVAIAALARILTLEAFAHWAILLGIILPVSGVLAAGYPIALSRSLATNGEHSLAREVPSALLGNTLIAIASILLVAFLAVTGLLPRDHLGAATFIPVALVILLTAVAWVQRFILHGQKRAGALNALALGETFLRLGLGIGLAWAGAGVHGLLWGWVTSLVVSLVVGQLLVGNVVLTPPRIASPSWAFHRSAIMIAVGGIGIQVLMMFDVLILGAAGGGEEAVATYQTAVVLGRFPMGFVAALVTSSFPFLAASGSVERARAILAFDLRFFGYILAPLLLATSILAEPLAVLAFGTRFADAAVSIPFVAGGTLFLSVAWLLATALQAEGRQRELIAPVVVAALLQFGLIVLLGERFGARGAAAAFAASAAVACAWIARSYFRGDLPRVDVRNLIPMATGLAATIFVCLLASGVPAGWPTLLVLFGALLPPFAIAILTDQLPWRSVPLVAPWVERALAWWRARPPTQWRERLADLTLVGLFAAPALFWGDAGSLYIGGDILVPLRPISYFERMSTWTNVQAGLPGWYFVTWPWAGFYALGTYLGFGLPAIEHAEYFLTWFAGGAGVYLLARHWFTGPRSRVAGLLAALAFLYSPMAFYMPAMAYRVASVLPWTILAVDRIVRADTLPPTWPWWLALTIVPAILAVDLPSYKFFIVFIILVAIQLLGFVIFRVTPLGRTARRAAGLVAFGLAVSAWFILPVWGLLGSTSATGELLEGASLVFGDEGSTTVTKTLFVQGPNVGGALMARLADPWILGVSLVLLGCIVLGALLGATDPFVRIATAIFVAGVLMQTGPNPPLGDLFKFALEKWPFLRGFRTVGTIGMVTALGSSLLLAAMVTHVPTRKVSIGSPVGLAAVGLGIMLLVQSFPLVDGSILAPSQTDPYKRGFDLPPEYEESYATIEARGAGGIAVVPAINGYLTARWHDRVYFGPIPHAFLTDRPVVMGPFASYGFTYMRPEIEQLYNTTLSPAPTSGSIGVRALASCGAPEGWSTDSGLATGSSDLVVLNAEAGQATFRCEITGNVSADRWVVFDADASDGVSFAWYQDSQRSTARVRQDEGSTMIAVPEGGNPSELEVLLDAGRTWSFRGAPTAGTIHELKVPVAGSLAVAVADLEPCSISPEAQPCRWTPPILADLILVHCPCHEDAELALTRPDGEIVVVDLPFQEDGIAEVRFPTTLPIQGAEVRDTWDAPSRTRAFLARDVHSDRELAADRLGIRFILRDGFAVDAPTDEARGFTGERTRIGPIEIIDLGPPGPPAVLHALGEDDRPVAIASTNPAVQHAHVASTSRPATLTWTGASQDLRWRAYSGDVSVLGAPFAEELPPTGPDSWTIPEGTSEVTLIYGPQVLLAYGALVSVTAATLVVGAIALAAMTGRRRERRA